MRDQWNSKLGFLIAAIGSAVGLGNLWRFPYTAATNGGGSFLLPYFFAILTAGIPLLILEYTIGKKYKGGAPVSLARINKKFEWLGWVQIMVCFMILIYYFAIVVWVLKYIVYSVNQKWGDDPTTFFVSDFLHLSGGATEFGGINTGLIAGFLIAWAIVAFILYKGVSKGIERACKICLPVLLLLTVILVIRGVTLSGASAGLEYMFKPDWSQIANPDVWVAAYGQVFYSLSIGFAIMISYSSYLPRKTDVVNSAFITACANHGFEVFAGIGVFAVVGHMALVQGQTIEDVAAGGVGLAFMTFPTAISNISDSVAVNAIFGICFFGSLLTAGLTSVISIAQPIITSVADKFGVSSRKATTIVLIPAFICSILFITDAGLNILDIVDNFINNIGVAAGGLIEALLLGWFFDIEGLRKEANSYSNFNIGKWWKYSLKIVTVGVLGVMVVLNTIDLIKNGYGGYSNTDVFVFGWCVIFIVAIGAIVLTKIKGREGYADLEKAAAKEV